MMSARCPGARGDDDLRERVLGVCRRGGENRDKRGAAADDGVWAARCAAPENVHGAL